MRKAPLILLIVVSVAGMWLGTDLVDKHFKLIHQPDVDFESICDMGETLNCSKVNSSKYSSFTLGEGRAELPVAIPALGFFALAGLVGLLPLFGVGEDKSRKALAALFGLSVLGVFFGLYLVYVQAFLLKAWCLFCLGIDVSTLLVGVFALIAHGGGLEGIKADLKTPDKSLLVIGAVVLLAVDCGAYGSYNGKVTAAGGLDKETLVGNESPSSGSSSSSSSGHSADDGHGHGEEPKNLDDMSPEEREAAMVEARAAIKEFLAAHGELDRQTIAVNSFDATKGNPDAKVTVVEFADFECPHCQQAAHYMQDIAQRYYDLVHFAFRHYPLGHPCNDQVSRNMHPMACEAAWGAQCALREDVFFDFHNHAFDSMGNLSSRKLVKIAETVGMDKARFQECINRNDIRQEVVDQLRQGRDLGVRGTPSFFVNGRELGSIHPMAVEAAIRFELVQAGIDPATLPADNEDLFPD